MLSRTFQCRHPLHAKHQLRRFRNLFRHADGTWRATIRDEKFPDDMPSLTRVEYQETWVLNQKDALAFEDRTHTEMRRVMEEKENDEASHDRTAPSPQPSRADARVAG